ncbi:MAG: hypothetical protein EOO61_22535 [Hymenobacter sp.]|nr:MAG: hypothetical protein EOO61_22535 [Hymenobacter sp.]
MQHASKAIGWITDTKGFPVLVDPAIHTVTSKPRQAETRSKLSYSLFKSCLQLSKGVAYLPDTQFKLNRRLSATSLNRIVNKNYFSLSSIVGIIVQQVINKRALLDASSKALLV